MQLSRRHGLGSEEVRRRVDRLAADLGRRYALSTEWRGNDLEVSGSQVSGRISVSDAEIAVNLRLGFGLKLMEGPIRAAIEDAMDRHLA